MTDRSRVRLSFLSFTNYALGKTAEEVSNTSLEREKNITAVNEFLSMMIDIGALDSVGGQRPVHG